MTEDLDITKRRKLQQQPAATPGLRTMYDGSDTKTITDGTNTLKTAASTPTGTMLKPITGEQPATLGGLAANPTVLGTTRGNGYSFGGTAGDAARFMEPTGVNADTVVAMKRQFAQLNPAPALRASAPTIEMPKYLGPESGLGWKTRLGKYKEELDVYNRATGNKTAMDIEGMREASAGQHALMQADTARAGLLAEAPLRKAQVGRFEAEAGLDALKANAQKKLIDPNTPDEERDRITKSFAALSGNKQNRPQVIPGHKITGVGPDNLPFEKYTAPLAVDPDTNTYTELKEAKAPGTTQAFKAPTSADIIKMRANAKDPVYQEFWKKNFGDAKF